MQIISFSEKAHQGNFAPIRDSEGLSNLTYCNRGAYVFGRSVYVQILTWENFALSCYVSYKIPNQQKAIREELQE